MYFSSATDPIYLSTQIGVFCYAFLSLITLNNLVRKLNPYRLLHWFKQQNPAGTEMLHFLEECELLIIFSPMQIFVPFCSVSLFSRKILFFSVWSIWYDYLIWLTTEATHNAFRKGSKADIIVLPNSTTITGRLNISLEMGRANTMLSVFQHRLCQVLLEAFWNERDPLKKESSLYPKASKTELPQLGSLVDRHLSFLKHQTPGLEANKIFPEDRKKQRVTLQEPVITVLPAG